VILVTGGAGFIGSNIAAALCARGEEVAVCDRLGSDGRWQNIAKHDVVDIVAPERLPDWLASHSDVTAVVHMGAISATTEQDADLLYRNNVETSRLLWRHCARRGLPFVYASSAATYGDGGAGFDDGLDRQALLRLRPLNAYGWSKLAFDRHVARAVARGERPPQWAGLRFFNVYGPNEYHKGDMRSVVCKSFQVVRAGKPVRLFRSHRPDCADGEQARDFVYVADCVDVVLWLLANPAVSGLFNLGTGQARSFLALTHAVFVALGEAPRIEFIDMPEAIRGRYQYFTEAAMGRLRAAGYARPFTPLEDGVRDYVQGYLATDDPYR
jgi:ADP-L-glycero-D-manno-heptose 6-epimerase